MSRCSSSKAKPPLEPSSVAMSEAVGTIPNPPKKAPTTQLGPIQSDEEFSFQGIEGEDDTPDSPEPIPQSRQQEVAESLQPLHYDQAIVEHKWNYKLLTQSDNANAYKNAHNITRSYHWPVAKVIQKLEAQPFYVWSNVNLAAYLVLTTHWISADESNGCLALKAALIGFHHLKKKHMGVNLARTTLHLLDRAGVTLNIGHFMLDNTKNNAVAI
ncbi:hypothetical protein BJY52DRAFT_1228127 [Lactarius psammicola]|nr:hypothetical protein BJY52DRAFT_1228127 [Lactarius psammicola]